jgi:hypothetical protein
MEEKREGKRRFDLRLIWYLVMMVVFIVMNIPFGSMGSERSARETRIDPELFIENDSAMSSKMRFSIQALERDPDIRPVVDEDWQNILGRYIREELLTEEQAITVYDYVQARFDALP